MPRLPCHRPAPRVQHQDLREEGHHTSACPLSRLAARPKAQWPKKDTCTCTQGAQHATGNLDEAGKNETPKAKKKIISGQHTAGCPRQHSPELGGIVCTSDRIRVTAFLGHQPSHSGRANKRNPELNLGHRNAHNPSHDMRDSLTLPKSLAQHVRSSQKGGKEHEANVEQAGKIRMVITCLLLFSRTRGPRTPAQKLGLLGHETVHLPGGFHQETILRLAL